MQLLRLQGKQCLARGSRTSSWQLNQQSMKAVLRLNLSRGKKFSSCLLFSPSPFRPLPTRELLKLCISLHQSLVFVLRPDW